MKKTKKKVATLIACGLIATLGVGASVAYLTDGEETKNTFTMGKVSVDLYEANYVANDNATVVPNEEIAKDPTIANTGDNDFIAYIGFDIPMANVKMVGYDGTAQTEASYQELFDFRSGTDVYDSVNDGWVLVSSAAVDTDGDGTPDQTTYLYGYNNVVKAKVDASAAVGNPGEDGYIAAVEAQEATQVPSLYDYVRVADIIEGQIDEDQFDINVRAYAIQSDFLQNSDNAELNDNIDVSGELDKDTLTQIFNLFAKQNDTVGNNGAMAGWIGLDGTDAKTAGAGNTLDLLGVEHN